MTIMSFQRKPESRYVLIWIPFFNGMTESRLKLWTRADDHSHGANNNPPGVRCAQGLLVACVLHVLVGVSGFEPPASSRPRDALSH